MQVICPRCDERYDSKAMDMLAAENERLRSLIDETLTNMQALANLTDDATASEIIDHVADRLGAALGV